MAVGLGKRKRATDAKFAMSAGNDDDNSGVDDAARALFQRAFEAKFKPLEVKALPSHGAPGEDSEGDDSEAESDWGGLSEDDEEVAVEVIQHAEPTFANEMDRIFDRKAFMSSKPPRLEDNDSKPTPKTPTPGTKDDGDGTDSTNLKHDLELQRLLRESHLLHPSTFHGSSTTPEGKGRLKALDLRLQDLGAKASVLQQDKMPLSHRRGIASKTASREARRRKEAAENGVILEKARGNAPKAQKRRERGIANPGIGRFRGGTLSLSARDVRTIQNSKSDARGKKARRK